MYYCMSCQSLIQKTVTVISGKNLIQKMVTVMLPSSVQQAMYDAALCQHSVPRTDQYIARSNKWCYVFIVWPQCFVVYHCTPPYDLPLHPSLLSTTTLFFVSTTTLLFVIYHYTPLCDLPLHLSLLSTTTLLFVIYHYTPLCDLPLHTSL